MTPQSTCSPGPHADDPTCAEADLVALVRAGDEAAIAQLVDQWSPVMLRVARSFVDSPPANQRVLLHRARAVLREALAEYYRG